MRITFPQFLTPKAAAEKTRRLPRERTLELMALAAILLLAAVLRFSNLDAIGYANTYYTAAVKSMLQSWHNFFFVAAEPGGSVTVDKPPVGFWLQAVSAYFLGVNGFAVVLPQLIAGLLSVILIDYLVRRSFGMFAGLLAALVLAVTPVVIATDRNNTIDSTLILTLLLAAWAFIKATETARLRYLLLGAVLVGIGFNIKMLQAYLPLPAFYALYFLKSSERLRRKVGKLALASALLLVISLSWSLAVDLTPAGQRPYVGSSGDNSELSLIVGYNGIQRLLGMFGRRGGAPAGGPPAGFPQSGLPQGDEFPPVGQDDGGSSGFPQSGPDGAGFPQPGGPGGASGFMGTGQPGPLRLFISPLSKEMSWLLPFGILSILLLTFRGLRTAPSSPEENTGIRPSSFVVRPSSVVHRLPSSLLLWSTWLLTGLIFFSIAGFFHQYYLSMLAPPLAALVGAGSVGLWELHKRRPWLASGLLLVGAGLTLVFQVYTARAFIDSVWWLPLLLVLLFVGGILLLAGTLSRLPQMAGVGFALLISSMLVTPGIWSALTTFRAGGNQVLPAAYGGDFSGPMGQRGGFFRIGDGSGLQVNQVLLDYLQANTQKMKYLMAVPSSQAGSGYVLATGRPVLYMGGFSGQDQVVTAEDLSQLVEDGQLRYILWGERNPGGGARSDISSWVTTQCTPVPGLNLSPDVPSRSPDGSSAQPDGGNLFPRGMEMQSTLYDCGR